MSRQQQLSPSTIPNCSALYHSCNAFAKFLSYLLQLRTERKLPHPHPHPQFPPYASRCYAVQTICVSGTYAALALWILVAYFFSSLTPGPFSASYSIWRRHNQQQKLSFTSHLQAHSLRHTQPRRHLFLKLFIIEMPYMIHISFTVADPGFPVGVGGANLVGGGGANSRGGLVSKNLYIKTKESGPLGGARRRRPPPGSDNALHSAWS